MAKETRFIRVKKMRKRKGEKKTKKNGKKAVNFTALFTFFGLDFRSIVRILLM